MRAEEKIEKKEAGIEVRVEKGVVEILKGGKVCSIKPEMLEQLADFLERKKSLDDSGIMEALSKHDRYGFYKENIQRFYNQLLDGGNPYSRIAYEMAYKLGLIDEKSNKVSGLGERIVDVYSKVKLCESDNVEIKRSKFEDKLSGGLDYRV